MEIVIRPVEEEELDAVMPLIGAYQEFYEVTGVSRDQTWHFFHRFIGSTENGWLYAAWDGEEPVGFACYYRHKNSLVAASTVLLHDLYVIKRARGQGIGRRFIEEGRELARRLGAPVLEWSTAPDNARAQRLYDSTGAERSTWLTYELEVDGPRS